MTNLQSENELSIKVGLEKKDEINKKDRECCNEENYDLNDLIGPFGIYQISVMVFYIIREAITSFDNVVLSLALPLDDTYQCVINGRK